MTDQWTLPFLLIDKGLRVKVIMLTETLCFISLCLYQYFSTGKCLYLTLNWLFFCRFKVHLINMHAHRRQRTVRKPQRYC